MSASSLLLSIRASAPDSNGGPSPDGELAPRNMLLAEEEVPSMWNLVLGNGRSDCKEKASAAQAEPVRPAGKS